MVSCDIAGADVSSLPAEGGTSSTTIRSTRGRCPIARLARLGPLRPYVAGALRRIRPPAPDVWQGPTEASVHRGPGIRAITDVEYAAVAAAAPAYYKGRARYTGTAARLADELIARHDLRTALELGPHLRPLVVGADVMDRKAPTELLDAGQVLIHDARRQPWPLDDRSYDLFIALQVFEHLGDRQRGAFEEVRRIARHAIISLPIDWVMDDPSHSHHQISDERARSWFAPVEPTAVVLGNGGARKRVIYVFEDLTPV